MPVVPVVVAPVLQDKNMSIKPLDLTGGKSVYCFNEYQMKQAFDLFNSETDSGQKVRESLAKLDTEMNRNELATLAFVIIDRLNQTA